jgi:hypothetical protein
MKREFSTSARRLERAWRGCGSVGPASDSQGAGRSCQLLGFGASSCSGESESEAVQKHRQRQKKLTLMSFSPWRGVSALTDGGQECLPLH